MRVLKLRSVGWMMLLGAAALVADPRESAATLIASESFSYPIGELNGQSGGTGLSGSWSAVVANSEVVDPGTPLSYNVGGIVNEGGNRAALVNGTQSTVASRNLSVSQTGDFYFSFLVRFTGTLSATDRFFFWGFNGTRFGGGVANPPGIGIIADNDGVSQDFVIRPDIAASGGQATGGGQITANSTYFLVGRLDKNNTTNRYDRIDLWVNPTSSSETAPTFSNTFADAVTLLGTATALRFRTSAGDTFVMDELLIGTTWADVVPVPEPGSFATLLCGALVLWMFRRRS